MPFVVESRRRSLEKLRAQYPGAPILDVTSHAPDPWVRFSPFYPHGDIPVPFSPGTFSMSVEGIWQGLKVFEQQDVDPAKFAIANMKNLKRTVRRFGKVLGTREGVAGERLLGYIEARRAVYLPAYRWVLDHRLQALLDELRALGQAQTVLLLDYTTNGDVDNPAQPLSHAALITHYLEDRWPA